jgi:hypothetical protein
MATIKAIGALNPKSMRVDGTAIHIYDKATAATIGDVLEFAIPSGLEIMRLDVRGAAATMTFSAGIRPARSDSTLATNATFFAAAGQAFTAGNKLVPVAAVKFDEDTILTITTAVAAGLVEVVIDGNAVGAK